LRWSAVAQVHLRAFLVCASAGFTLYNPVSNSSPGRVLPAPFRTSGSTSAKGARRSVLEKSLRLAYESGTWRTKHFKPVTAITSVQAKAKLLRTPVSGLNRLAR
jgi:uncharacterized membrane protein